MIIVKVRGLSPLARGTLGHIQAAADQPRFIPAGAGNTPDCCRRRPARTVYPRWRGEHWIIVCIYHLRCGLSPLARGTQAMERRENPDPRFIPAGAGNTHARHQRRRPGAVYPRWRGEHSHSTWRIRFLPGLSPLARGTRSRRIELKRYLRFIPAGAGNTSLPRWDMNPEAVYPRWRGEHPFCAVPRGSSTGLSPLARGTHINVHDDLVA